MHQWNLLCLTGSSVGSATTVESRDTRLQSVGVAVNYHAPINAHLTSRQHQDKIDSKKLNKIASLILYRVHLLIYKLLWLGSLS